MQLHVHVDLRSQTLRTILKMSRLRASSEFRRCFSATPTISAEIYPEFEKRGLPVLFKPEFYIPRAERARLNITAPIFKFGEEGLMRHDRSDPTRELNFTPLHWKHHKNPFRKLKYIINTLKSSPVQRLAFPDLAIVGGISAALTVYNELIAGHHTEVITMNSGGLAGTTSAIGLLAAFRLKESYSRYDEARKFWGDTINSTRDLAGNTMMWMTNEAQRTRMCKLIRAFPVAYNFHVHRKGGHHGLLQADSGGKKPSFEDRIQAEFQTEMLDIYMDGKNDDDLRRICHVKYKGGNGGLEVLTLMRETIAASSGKVDGIYVREMDEQVQRLCFALGASERLLRTPLPTSFTRHTARLLFLWYITMPIGLYPILGPFLTLPTALVTAYAVLGIEDVGVQMEEPFDLLPLRQYSDVIFDSVNMIEKNYVPYGSKPSS
jgi:predicted membrane chloride channel (bestrophin family)